MSKAANSQAQRRELAGEPSRIPASCVVFTPGPLANAMVRALGDSPGAMWLEPCVGQGAFLESLAAAQIPSSRIRGLDLEVSRSVQDKFARTLRGEEFLRWSINTHERFDRIIGNPPFAALNRMPGKVQRSALKIGIPGTEAHVSLGANAWFAFLCASISLLRPGGSLAFVLPAAWDYADYAAYLRTSIRKVFEDVEVHRCRQPLFDLVLDGSVVLIARRYRRRRLQTGLLRPIRRRTYKTPHRLIASLRPSLPPGVLASENRVVSFSGEAFLSVRDAGFEKASSPNTARKLRLGDVMQIRLGGVTGDARYFVLSEEERCTLHLPAAACRPVISRARHLAAGAITRADWCQLRNDGERVWLVDPTPSQLRHHAVKAYLARSLDNGGCNKSALKVRSRDPWYRTPIQSRIDGFMSGMSGWGPWVVFRTMPQLAATNTLYVVRFLTVVDLDAQAAWAIWLLTSEAARLLRRIGRQYADGLVKFEPGDIAELPIRSPTQTAGANIAYQRAVHLLLQGKKGASRREADRWFSKSARSASQAPRD